MECYSWEGEDILVRKIMHDVFDVKKGFYLDIGAHHPVNLSNTALLYSQGWRGVNIDATPGSMESFRRLRPEDVNLEVAIGPSAGRRPFSCFANPALNGFHSQESLDLHASRGNQPTSTVDVDCMTIGEVFEKHVADRHVDVLSIDIEGMDYAILETLDLTRWRPTLIVVEILGVLTVEDVISSDVCVLLSAHRYSLFSRLHFSAIFMDMARHAIRNL
jgi:FkbM family methyltransferase